MIICIGIAASLFVLWASAYNIMHRNKQFFYLFLLLFLISALDMAIFYYASIDRGWWPVVFSVELFGCFVVAFVFAVIHIMMGVKVSTFYTLIYGVFFGFVWIVDSIAYYLDNHLGVLNTYVFIIIFLGVHVACCLRMRFRKKAKCLRNN